MTKRGKGDGSYMPVDMYTTIEAAKTNYEKASSFWLKVRSLEIWKTIAYLCARRISSPQEAESVYQTAPPDSLAKKLAIEKMIEFGKAESKNNQPQSL